MWSYVKISKSLIDGNQISFPWTLIDSIAAYWPGFHWNLSSIHSRLIKRILKADVNLIKSVLNPALNKTRLQIRLWKGPLCEAIINHLLKKFQNDDKKALRLRLWCWTETRTSYTNRREHVSNLAGNFLNYSTLKGRILPLNKPCHSRWIMKHTNHLISWPMSDRVRLT